MGRLAQTDGLTEFEQDILATVRDFTNREIIPVATELEHRDEYPAQIVEGMKKLGLFGLTIGEEYGGLGASLLLYALAVEEIARGWMSVSGIINTHFIVPGLTVPGKIEKMGYKGVDTTELILENVRVPVSRVLGGVTGRGFYQMMDGVEVGRVNVAARGCGVALRAFELGIAYAQQQHAFGKPIAQHQAIAFKLAEMATKVEAAHQMMVMAARRKDSGRRNDLEAGMAKYLASEYGKEVVEDSFRIHGGYGFSKEYEIERLYREAPMLLIGEGTAEIQKMIIGRRLLEEYQITGSPPRPGAT